MIEPHPARALHHGLKNNPRQTVRAALKRLTQGAQAFGIERGVETATRALDEDMPGQNALKEGVHPVDGIADGHGPLRVAVIAAPRDKEAGLFRPAPRSPVLHGHFQGRLHGYRPRIGIEDMPQIGWQKGQKPPAQFHGGLMGQAAKHDMGHPPGLPPQGLDKDGVAVTVNGAPPRGHPVHHFPAVAQADTHPGGAHRLPYRKRVQRRGIGMPQVFPVKIEDGAGRILEGGEGRTGGNTSG